MYSDASYEPGDKLPGLGWVHFKQESVPERRAALMPKYVLRALLPRKTKIYAAEAFAILAAVYEHLEDLQKTDAIFFVDNEAACAALIRGSIVKARGRLLHRQRCPVAAIQRRLPQMVRMDRQRQ